MAVKKSVVDFVLGDALRHQKKKKQGTGLSAERIDLSSIALKYKHK